MRKIFKAAYQAALKPDEGQYRNDAPPSTSGSQYYQPQQQYGYPGQQPALAAHYASQYQQAQPSPPQMNALGYSGSQTAYPYFPPPPGYQNPSPFQAASPAYGQSTSQGSTPYSELSSPYSPQPSVVSSPAPQGVHRLPPPPPSPLLSASVHSTQRPQSSTPSLLHPSNSPVPQSSYSLAAPQVSLQSAQQRPTSPYAPQPSNNTSPPVPQTFSSPSISPPPASSIPPSSHNTTAHEGYQATVSPTWLGQQPSQPRPDHVQERGMFQSPVLPVSMGNQNSNASQPAPRPEEEIENATNAIYQQVHRAQMEKLRAYSNAPPQTASRPEEEMEQATNAIYQHVHKAQMEKLRGPLPSSPQKVSQAHKRCTVRKILSLDGGGVRGLSTVLILRYLMEKLADKRGYYLEPWQEFDMIGGTSTGGLLAIMLGRLRMSLDDCEKAYLNLSREIFTPVRRKVNVPGKVYDFLQANGKFDSEPLERSIKTILSGKGMSEDELLKEFDEDACKVFVCAVRQDDSTATIRSYKTKFNDRLLKICKIWEAARATSAASRLFEPITIGDMGQMFVDGALRHNNPIDLIDIESSSVWPQQDRLIISIGTGIAPGQAVDGNLMNLVQTLAKIVTDSEERNRIFRSVHQDMVANHRLYRFNVDQGLASVGLEEHKLVNRIANSTDRYLDDPDVMRNIELCAQIMNEGGQRLDLLGGEG
ncbi:MAG: hypothetical protein M1816_006383 [Peltula sp. TS41687]|nr:MAG: hypothetical protein M1816_006383 [Peltula sp. TS41687]